MFSVMDVNDRVVRQFGRRSDAEDFILRFRRDGFDYRLVGQDGAEVPVRAPATAWVTAARWSKLPASLRKMLVGVYPRKRAGGHQLGVIQDNLRLRGYYRLADLLAEELYRIINED